MKKFITSHPILYKPLFLGWKFAASVWYTIQLILRHKIKVHASSCTYYFLVSLVPVVILVGWGAAVLVDKLGVVDNLEMFDNIQLYSQMQRMTSSLGLATSSSLKAVGFIGVIYGLWYASSLMKAIRGAFVVIFPAKPGKKVIISMLIAYIMVPLIMVLAIMVSSLSMAVTQVFRWLLAEKLQLVSQSFLAAIITPAITVLVITIATYACYMLLSPGRPRGKAAFLGAFLFALYFMVLQQGLSFVMVKLIASYERYGALGSLLLLLLWAYLVFQGMFAMAEFVYVIDNFPRINRTQYLYTQFKEKPNIVEKIMMSRLPFGDNRYLTNIVAGELKTYDGTTLAFCKVRSGEMAVSHAGQVVSTLKKGEMYNQIGAHTPSVELTALSDSKVLVVSEKAMHDLVNAYPDTWASVSASEATYLAYMNGKKAVQPIEAEQ